MSATGTTATTSRARPAVRGTDFLLGLPAVAAAAVLAAALAAAPGADRLARAYEAEAGDRVKAGDLPAALVCYKRLAALAPGRAEPRFALALVLERLDRGPEAEAVARSIAPGDRPGYPLAHLWLARRIIADRDRLAAQAGQAEGHLLRFLQAAPRSDEARATLGGLYALTGRFRDARTQLEPVAGKEPERLLDLARACRELGDRDESLRRARAALDSARARAEARPDDRASRLLWANACVFLEDYPGALDVLDRGFALTAAPVFRQAAAGVCAVWADGLTGADEATAARRLAVLERGLAADPGNRALLGQLNNLMAAGGAPAGRARAAVRGLLAAGKAPALAHFALGNDAWARGAADEARGHWEQAYRLDPKLAVVANNLAYTLAYREPADVPQALALIDRALSESPRDPRLRGTRGQVLVKAGRFKEAVTDLEAALAAGQASRGIHQALAAAYDELAMPEMAAEHRKAAP